MEALSNLGIDFWSILLYLINMGLLVFLMGKYLFPKILHFLDERRELIRNNLNEAENLKNAMGHERSVMEKEKEELRHHLNQELTEGKKVLEEKQRKVEAEIDAKKMKMLDEVKKVMADEKEKLMGGVQKELLTMVQKMVTHIVSHDIPKETIEKSVSGAWEQFKHNPHA